MAKNGNLREVVYTLNPDGTIEAEAFNFQGKQCELLNSPLKGLEAETLEHKDKPEKHQRIAMRKRVQQR